ncbi:MAG TPA: hypothetical protein VD866_24915 [Urbifossiella sp.]|nr:hypothetical protein [Urbifossiella sp.]
MLLANVVWPALILEGRLLTWWAIAAGLAAEYVALRYRLGLTSRVALRADLLMNAVSTAAGVVLIPAAGVAWEYFPGLILYPILHVGTFNPVTWVATCLLAALVNAGVEGTVLRVAFGVKFRWAVFLTLSVANMVSVGLAFASLSAMPVRT